MKKSLLTLSLFLIAILAFAPKALAANTCLWRGTDATHPTYWNTAANWTNCGGVVPTSADDVVFDNSASGYNISMDSYGMSCKSLNTTGTTNPISITRPSNQALIIYGDLTLKTGDSVSLFFIYFYNNATITQSGATINSPLDLTVQGKTYTLGSNINIGSNAFYVERGTFDTSANNYSVTCGIFGDGGSSYIKTLTLNSSTLNVSNVAFTATGANAPTITSTTHTINLTSTVDVTANFAGKSWGTVNASISSGHTLSIGEGGDTFKAFNMKTPGSLLKFTAGSTTTFGAFSATGTSANHITIGSITAAQSTLTKTGGGKATCKYCTISYSVATPATTWYAPSSTNSGNNRGWTFAGSTVYLNPCGGNVTGKDGLTYGTVQAEDGKCWLDRNLGATRVATAYNDQWAGYGSYYQWGRAYDGHQATTSLIVGSTTVQTANSYGPVAGSPPYSSILSPYTSYFATSTGDWLPSKNNNLWGDANKTNNVCPSGWHVPTQSEWNTWTIAAKIKTCSSGCPAAAFATKLKLPAAGSRNYSNGSLVNQSSNGYYWSATPSNAIAYGVYFSATSVNPAGSYNRANGFSVRCIQDNKILAYVNTTGSNKSTVSIAGPTSGLVGYWSFNGADTNWSTNTTKDLSGSNNTGTLVSMSTTTSPVAGVIGQALKFNGTSSYVDAGQASSLNFGTGSFTVSLWVKANPVQGGGSFPMIINKSSGDLTDTGATGWGLNLFTTSYAFRLNDGTAGQPDIYPFFTTLKNDNIWRHVVVTVTNSAIQGYVNGAATGASVARTRTGSTDTATNLNLARWREYTRYWNGSLDDVRIYSRALSQSEITQLYNLGKAKLNIKL